MDSVLCGFSLNNHHKGIVSRDFLPLFTQHWTRLGPLSKGINTIRFWLGLCCPIRILKGESSEIFTSSIFHHSNTPGPGPNGSISQEYNKVNWLINVELNLRSGHTIFLWVNLPRVSYPDVSISPGCNTQEESIIYGQVRAFFARCLEKIRISCWENSHADTFVSYWENLDSSTFVSYCDIEKNSDVSNCLTLRKWRCGPHTDQHSYLSIDLATYLKQNPDAGTITSNWQKPDAGTFASYWEYLDASTYVSYLQNPDVGTFVSYWQNLDVGPIASYWEQSGGMRHIQHS